MPRKNFREISSLRRVFRKIPTDQFELLLKHNARQACTVPCTQYSSTGLITAVFSNGAADY